MFSTFNAHFASQAHILFVSVVLVDHSIRYRSTCWYFSKTPKTILYFDIWFKCGVLRCTPFRWHITRYFRNITRCFLLFQNVQDIVRAFRKCPGQFNNTLQLLLLWDSLAAQCLLIHSTFRWKSKKTNHMKRSAISTNACRVRNSTNPSK